MTRKKYSKNKKTKFHSFKFTPIFLIVVLGLICVYLYQSDLIFHPLTINRIIEEDPGTARNSTEKKLINSLNKAANKEARAKTKKQKEKAVKDLLITGQAVQNIKINSSPTSNSPKQELEKAEHDLINLGILNPDGSLNVNNEIGKSLEASTHKKLKCQLTTNGECIFADNVQYLPPSTHKNEQVVPSMIIIHWDENKDSNPENWITSTTYNGLVGNNASAHFAVGTDGVLQMLPTYHDKVMRSRASTGYYNVINIEFAGFDFNNNPPTNKEINDGAELITKLITQYNLKTDDIFGHYEKDTWKIEDGTYIPCDPMKESNCKDTGKSDPSPEFVEFIKEKVKEKLAQ